SLQPAVPAEYWRRGRFARTGRIRCWSWRGVVRCGGSLAVGYRTTVGERTMLQDDGAPPGEPELSSVQGLVPGTLTRALGTGRDPQARWLSGAVLIADVAGYTPLTERLSELGDEGLGLLFDLLNRHFGRYLEEVSSCGGELVTFSGDAVVAAFLD